MAGIKRDWDVLSDTERRLVIEEIVGYFEIERNEKIGVVAAGQMLDLVLRMTNRPIYNKALDDIMLLLEQNVADIDVSLRK